MKQHPSQQEIEFYTPLIASYLKYGSVDKVFASLYQNPGVSYPHFHRILQKWDIIKSAGSNSHFAEAIYFMSALTKNNLPLETVYKTMPPSLRISAATLHRILHCVKTGLVRRSATGLIITPENDSHQILIGKDISTPRAEIGKPFGSLSLPMTFSRYAESYHTSVLRVLQQEVLTDLALINQIPKEIIPPFLQPLLFIDIADVRVNIFHLQVSPSLSFSSYKLNDLALIPADNIISQMNVDQFRAGVPEIISAFLETQKGHLNLPLHLDSNLNLLLATVPAFE